VLLCGISPPTTPAAAAAGCFPCAQNASVTPTVDQLKRHSEQRAEAPQHTLPPVKFVAARDQIAALCGSATPTPQQLAALAARRPAATSASSASAGGASSTGLSASDLKLLAELESGTVHLSQKLLALAEQSGKVYDAAETLATQRGLPAAPPRSARPALAACTAALNRASASSASSASASSSSSSGAGSACASAGPPSGASVWARAASSSGPGTLTIAASDRVLSRLAGFASRWSKGITASVTGSASETVLGTASREVRGTTAVLFALFPHMVGGTASEHAKVSSAFSSLSCTSRLCVCLCACARSLAHSLICDFMHVCVWWCKGGTKADDLTQIKSLHADFSW
jgi:hypothetical protein